MSTKTGRFGPSFPTLARAALAVLAAVIMSSGVWLSSLDWRVGPSGQRVNIRWAPDTAADPSQRARAQERLRLTAGEEVGPSNLVVSPRRSFEPEHRPDPVGPIGRGHALDRPGPASSDAQSARPSGVGARASRGRVGSARGAAAPALGGGAPLAQPPADRRRPRDLRQVLRAMRHVARAAAADVAARARAVVVMPATGTVPRPAVPGLQWTEVAAGLVIGLVFLAPLLAYGPADDEEVGVGGFSSQVFYRSLFDGQWTFWSNDLGFGTPMPIGQRLDFHPVFALASLWSLRAALSAVWIVHVAVMVVYFLRLAAVSGIRPLLRTCLLACYVFSMPSVFYFYQTDWVSVIVSWSLFPVWSSTCTGPCGIRAATSFWVTAARLGLLAGFWVLNSHPGHLSTLALVLGVYVAGPGARAGPDLLLSAGGVHAGHRGRRGADLVRAERNAGVPQRPPAGDAGGLYPRPVPCRRRSCP